MHNQRNCERVAWVQQGCVLTGADLRDARFPGHALSSARMANAVIARMISNAR